VAHLDFAWDLYRTLTPETDRPFCWSPYSVAGALGLTASLTAGDTRAELVSVLRGADQPLTAAARLRAPSPGEAPVLAVSNTLWVREGLAVREPEAPGGVVRTAPFASEPEQARQQINADVEATTRGLIPDLLAPGAIDSRTLAALVNALYLKDAWVSPLNPSATVDKPFHTPQGTRDVPTMHATGRYGYAATLGWQVVALPAVGGVEAVILLPDSDLASAEPGLNGPTLRTLLASVSPTRVELLLPSFKVTGQADLTGPLESAGVRGLFTSAADFSPLTDSPLGVSTAAHRAVLRVDERGLEGAAATVVAMSLAAFAREAPPLRVEVDHPFLFLVRHRDSGAVYFFARVVAP
jgi:serpin B